MESKTGGSTRRPRVREVSSRFMTPLTPSSSSSSSSAGAGDLQFFTSNSPKQNHQIQQRSVSAQRHRRRLKMTEGDENRSSETTAARSLDSPFTLSQGVKVSKQVQSKILKENWHTPTPIFVPPPSKSRFSQESAATRLLQLNGISAISPLSSCNGRERNLTLPPVPTNSKIPVDIRKQRKVSEQLEDVHSLKLLYNRYLQWRFANANSELKTRALRAQTETMEYSFGLKISELSNMVRRKRIELQCLSRIRALLWITESQTPCLEQWSTIEEEYSTSLSRTIQALSNASLRIPLDADIMVDNKELAEALVVASKVMDNITQNVENYMSKAQEMENLVSELTRVSNRERSLIENCRIKLLQTQASNIDECSLRSQLIQQQKKSHVSENNSSPLDRDLVVTMQSIKD